MGHILQHGPEGAPPKITTLRYHERDWMDDAACRDSDPEIFFPLSYEMGARNAMKHCASCPVSIQCATYAWQNGIREGIWGGMTPIQRYRWAIAREQERILGRWRQQALAGAVNSER
jgi:WhiB family redox-sensing transcriptional regulator